jgi:hypothetical protein
MAAMRDTPVTHSRRSRAVGALLITVAGAAMVF